MTDHDDQARRSTRLALMACTAMVAMCHRGTGERELPGRPEATEAEREAHAKIRAKVPKKRRRRRR